jgi:hypothetical protein
MKKFEKLGKVLTRDEAKKISGGTCYATCPSGKRWGLDCPDCRTDTGGFIMCGQTLMDFGCHSQA